MAKYANDEMMDAALDYIITNCDKQTVCSQQPTTYLEAVTTFMLAEVAIAGGNITKEDGSTSGRQFNVAAKNNVDVTNTGTGNHVSLVDTINSKLLFVTTAPAQAITAGNQVNIGSWQDQISDPT